MQMTDEVKEKMLLKMCSHKDNGTPDVPFVQSLIKERLGYLPEKKLYKFRTCEEKNLEMLWENCIWMSPANQFTDMFDAVINMDFTDNAEKVMRWMITHNLQVGYGVAKCFCDWTGHTMDFRPKEVQDFLDHCLDEEGIIDQKKALEYAQKAGAVEAISSLHDALNKFGSFREDMEKNASQWKLRITEKMNAIRNSMRNSMVIYCMTERMDNHSLWENYADKYRGFCVEYDFAEFSKKPYKYYENLAYLFPMSYVEKRPVYDMLPLLEGGLLEFFTGDDSWKKDSKLNATLNMHLLYKKDDYQYEREWRFARVGSIGQKCYFPFVSAIYTGKDISKDNLEKLLEIGKHLAVPVYSQEVNAFQNGFYYREVKEV